MQDFRQLKVWEKAHQLTLATYGATAAFPPEERFGLTSQLRRGSASIAANLAEGCVRSTDAEFCRFVWIAMGSASEVEYHLLLAFELGFLSAGDHGRLAKAAEEVKRMLVGLIGRLTADG